MASIPANPELYQLAKNIVWSQYAKNSAYRSGALQKLYKKLGGTYTTKKQSKNIDELPLARWFLESWKDIGNLQYPVYRPTKRITAETPLTVNEISETRLKQQAKLKQKYKGKKNLPSF